MIFFFAMADCSSEKETFGGPAKRTGAIPTHLPGAPSDEAKRSEARSPAEADRICGKCEKGRRNAIDRR